MSVDRAVLEGQSRDQAGKGPSRRLRIKGLIPAVIYGKKLEQPVHLAVPPDVLRKAIATPHRMNTLITIKVPGAPDRQVLLKDYQQDPVTRDILHADFLDVRENEPVKVKVPVVYTGKAAGVTDGGILSVQRRELEVWAKPQSIPEQIEVDVTHMKIAQALHINDVKLPEGVTVKSTVNFTLAVIAIPEREETPQAAAAAAATAAPAAAGAAAPAAGAAAPAAAAKKDEKKK